MTIRKRAVSIRMNQYDIDGVKKLAKRLGVRDSDVIRSAIKMMMTKLGSLTDVNVKGRSLVPVFVESGPDLLRHFDIDALRLEQIINEGVANELQVDCDDIRLLAMTVVQRPPARLGVGGSAIGSGQHVDNGEGERTYGGNLRQYFYDKYVYRAGALK